MLKPQIVKTQTKTLNYKESTTKEKLKRIYSIMMPILITQLAIMGMSVIDTMMSGHAGAVNLAGVAIGSSLWLPILTASSGLIGASTPIIAQHLGAGNVKDIAPSVRHGTYVAIVFAFIVIIVGFLFANPLISRLDLNPSVHKIALGYLGALAIGTIPLFINISFRSFVDTMNLTHLTMKLFLIALPINAFFNYCLIFGKFGLPRLGGIGAGWATTLTEFVLLGIFIFTINKVDLLKKYKVFSTIGRLEKSRLFEQLRIGIPSGIAIFFETSVFSWIAFAIAKFGTTKIAASQAALNIGGLLYMIPLSMSFALVIIVGYEVGAKNHKAASKYSKLGVLITLILIIIALILILFNKDFISSLYSSNPEIINTTSALLLLVACYQPFDALSVPIQGALRGYKDVKVPFYTSLCSYWLICLPSGYILDYKLNFGVESYFYGLMIGIFCNSLLLNLRFRYIKNKYKSF